MGQFIEVWRSFADTDLRKEDFLERVEDAKLEFIGRDRQRSSHFD